MSEVKYTNTHEWIEVIESEGMVGITERAQLEYGDIVYIELPSVDDEYEQGERIGIVETADGDRFSVSAPITGEIKAVNTGLEDDPDLINRSPEGDGWICRISVESPRELGVLMTEDEYEEYEEEEIDEDYMSETDFYEHEDEY